MAFLYGDDSHGRQRHGEVFDMGSLTAANPPLPLPSYARVTNLRNGHNLCRIQPYSGPVPRKPSLDRLEQGRRLLISQDMA